MLVVVVVVGQRCNATITTLKELVVLLKKLSLQLQI